MLSDQSAKSQAASRPALSANVSATPLNLSRSWESCAGLRESQVQLVGLELSITFDGLGEPIQYDAERGLLRYRGTMSHASFVQLQKVSRERHYQRALEQLFVASAMPLPGPATAKPWLIWTGTGTLTAIMLCGLWYALANRVPAKGPASNNKIATRAATPDSAAMVPPAVEKSPTSGSTSQGTVSQAQAR